MRRVAPADPREQADRHGSRARLRYRRATTTFLTAIVSKSVALMALLASVPLSLTYLGTERFGLWMTAVSAAGLLGFANLGFDKGLLNALAAADGRGDRAQARRLVSTAFVLLAGLVALLLLVAALSYPFTPWPKLLNATPAVAAEAGPVMAAIAACTLLALLAGLIDAVQSAHQQGFYNGLWDALGRLLGLGALFAGIKLGASLPWLVLGFAGGPLLASLGNAILLFARQRPWLTPRLKLVNRGAGATALRQRQPVLSHSARAYACLLCRQSHRRASRGQRRGRDLRGDGAPLRYSRHAAASCRRGAVAAARRSVRAR